MSRVPQIFNDLAARNRTGLMPFLCGGYPRREHTGESILALADAGADIIEIGIPFSDPIADGPVIAGAMHETLTQGTGPLDVFEDVKAVRPKVDVGLVAMVTVSIVHRFGAQQFAGMARDAGFDGLIVPDLPAHEGAGVAKTCADAGLTCSFLISPSTGPERAAMIAQASTGFVYLLARRGITGERHDAPDVASSVDRIRAASDIPIACGFGLSTPEHVRAVGAHADAAIVGSAVVRAMGEAQSAGADPVACASELIRSLASGTT